jgi:hypothetical protein
MDEKKTVNYKDYEAELNRIKALVDVTNDINVENLYRDGRSRDFIELGVRWSGIGTMSAEDTRAFIEKLEKAAKACDNFKYQGYTIVY